MRLRLAFAFWRVFEVDINQGRDNFSIFPTICWKRLDLVGLRRSILIIDLGREEYRAHPELRIVTAQGKRHSGSTLRGGHYSATAFVGIALDYWNGIFVKPPQTKGWRAGTHTPNPGFRLDK